MRSPTTFASRAVALGAALVLSTHAVGAQSATARVATQPSPLVILVAPLKTATALPFAPVQASRQRSFDVNSSLDAKRHATQVGPRALPGSLNHAQPGARAPIGAGLFPMTISADSLRALWARKRPA